MANIAQQRIQREFKEVVKSEEVANSGITLTLVGDDLTKLKVRTYLPTYLPTKFPNGLSLNF